MPVRNARYIMINELQELLDEKADLQGRIREIDHKLVDHVLNFEGTLKEGLKAGLIRLNFSAPAGFMKFVRQK